MLLALEVCQNHAGPGGPPTTVAGPSGGPPSGSTGPTNVAAAPAESMNWTPPAQSIVEQPIVAESTSALEDGSTFEDGKRLFLSRWLMVDMTTDIHQK